MTYGLPEWSEKERLSFEKATLGFFLSGPGISGPYSNSAINIAKVPGTQLPVTINNVNCGFHSQACDPDLNGGSHCEFYVNNLMQSNAGYSKTPIDGYTVPFVAENSVESCTWYHMKLAIGDAVDCPNEGHHDFE